MFFLPELDGHYSQVTTQAQGKRYIDITTLLCYAMLCFALHHVDNTAV